MGVPKVSRPGSSRSWTSLVKIIVAGQLVHSKNMTLGELSEQRYNQENKEALGWCTKTTYSFRRSGSFLDALWLAAQLGAVVL